MAIYTVRGLDILYFGELVWRVEKCLLPLFDNVAHYCGRILNKYSPFGDEKNINDSALAIKRNSSVYDSLEWSGIQHAWLGIAFSLLRYYREEGEAEQWHQGDLGRRERR